MSEKIRNKLVKELNQITCEHRIDKICDDCLADFIIEDRKRIVEPLIKLIWDEGKLMDTINNIDNAIDQTFINAGIKTSKD